MLFQGKHEPVEPLRALYYGLTSNTPFFDGNQTTWSWPEETGIFII